VIWAHSSLLKVILFVLQRECLVEFSLRLLVWFDCYEGWDRQRQERGIVVVTGDILNKAGTSGSLGSRSGMENGRRSNFRKSSMTRQPHKASWRKIHDQERTIHGL
jgi:hypothetical protein